MTKSSLLGICNATTVEPFTSGRLNKSATFEHVVGDNTEPTFVFCGSPTSALAISLTRRRLTAVRHAPALTPGVQPHCTKGMFSILNVSLTTEPFFLCDSR